MINFTAVSFSPLALKPHDSNLRKVNARSASSPRQECVRSIHARDISRQAFRTSRYLSRHVVSRAGQHARDERARPVFLKVSVKAAWPCGWGSSDIDLFLWTGRYAIAYKTPYTTFSSIAPPAQAASWSFCPRKRSSLRFKPSLSRTLLCKFSNHVRPPRRTPGTQGKELK